MPHFLSEIRALREEGKVHGQLITRIRILLGISLVMLCIVLYNVIARGTNPLICAGLSISGFLLGLIFFARMSPVQWNERSEIVQVGRMDKIGYTTLGFYIAFEIALRTFLHVEFPVSGTIYVLASVFGVLFGRGIGMLIEIHRVYRASHA